MCSTIHQKLNTKKREIQFEIVTSDTTVRFTKQNYTLKLN